MSYDVSVWCTKQFSDPAMLPTPEKWTIRDEHWSYEAKHWLVNTGPSDRVLPEDIPDEVIGALPGIEHLVEISLEPVGAPKAGYALLRKVAKAIAKESHGVIFDPQEDSVQLAPGIKRFTPPKRENEERFGLLEITWWFDHAQLLKRASIDSFLTLLEQHLPEAMPRRYGLYEPPQHIYEETGRDHLVAFLEENLADTIVWYANRPVAHLSFGVKTECDWQRLGDRVEYRCNCLSITADAAVLKQPGWQAGLRRFWEAASLALEPFFGDVRTLNGYRGHLPHVWVDAQTEQHPTRSWWWKGIPPKLGHAVVVGEPYLAHWPRLVEAGERKGNLVFLSTPDWSIAEDAAPIVGGVPKDIALSSMPRPQKDRFGGSTMAYPETYPATFPLGDPAKRPETNKSPWWKSWSK